MIDYLYSSIIRWRNRQFDTGRFSSYKSSLPVISIGNITTGGTGKSPFVQMLARYFRSTGKKVAIIGRGYKRTSKGFLLVSDGQKIYANAQQAGDELFMHAIALPEVTIIADEKRRRAIQWLEARGQDDIILLDDGFQHRYVDRTIDIVLIDNKTLSTRLIPLGHLREPLSSLQRATIICTASTVPTHKIHDLLTLFPKLTPHRFIYSAAMRTIRPAWSEPLIQQQSNYICDVITSIAYPERFHEMLISEGWHIEKKHIYSDHYSFTEHDVKYLCEHTLIKGSTVVMTTKDEAKLIAFSHIFRQYSIQCYVAEITMTLDDETTFYSLISQFITKK